MRNDDDNLYLISWDMQLKRSTTAAVWRSKREACRSCRSRLTRSSPPASTATDGCCLITWRIDAQGSFHRIRDTGEDGPEVKSISLAIAAGSPSQPIVTATVQRKSGRARIYAYGIDTSDLRIELRADSGNSMGNATMVTSARTGPPNDFLIVGCATDGDRDLLLIPFSVSRDGQTITRLTGKEAKAGAFAVCA